jgi:secreted PhoX family phosphatase
MLYVADFGNGKWVPLDFKNDSIFKDNGFKDQADVLVRAPEAAALNREEGDPPIGTPMDRCEDIEVHPETGDVYCALTNNELHGNFYGQIIRLRESDNDPTGKDFTYEVFAAGGPQTGFASPDNLAFDNGGNLWIVTDISSSSQNQGIYKPFKNNGAFFMPKGTAGPGGEVYQFASGPIGSELTGPFFTPNGKTLFLSVQHPGEESENTDNPTSTWPDGDIPRPAVVAITGDFA